jgi:hypothetical protein
MNFNSKSVQFNARKNRYIARRSPLTWNPRPSRRATLFFDRSVRRKCLPSCQFMINQPLRIVLSQR